MPKDNSELSRKLELEKTSRFLRPVSVPVQHSSYFSSERRCSSLDVSFSLDTSAKVADFSPKRESFSQLYFQVFRELFARVSFIYFFFCTVLQS